MEAVNAFGYTKEYFDRLRLRGRQGKKKQLPAEVRITEDGDIRITEDGAIRITES